MAQLGNQVLGYVSNSGLFETSRKELPILTPTAYLSLFAPLSRSRFSMPTCLNVKFYFSTKTNVPKVRQVIKISRCPQLHVLIS